jgi:magnesium chelatase family protein
VPARHNILFIGLHRLASAGKTMLARHIPTILPPMSIDEAIETTRIHSVAGIPVDGRGLAGTRRFRSPHHTHGDAGLIGGAVPRPEKFLWATTASCLSTNCPNSSNVLEVMRQPLENGSVTIARAAIPSPSLRFMLAAAVNPYPWGPYGVPAAVSTAKVSEIHFPVTFIGT